MINPATGFDPAPSFIVFKNCRILCRHRPTGGQYWSMTTRKGGIELQEEINDLDWKFQWSSAWNHYNFQQKAYIGKVALPVLEIIGNNWRKEDGLPSMLIVERPMNSDDSRRCFYAIIFRLGHLVFIKDKNCICIR